MTTTDPDVPELLQAVMRKAWVVIDCWDELKDASSTGDERLVKIRNDNLLRVIENLRIALHDHETATEKTR